MCSGLALGFAFPTDSWHLISALFPDKIGGRPAWLALRNLPRSRDLCCPTCSEPMAFLLQVNNSWMFTDERADCFHRFLFIFMCRNGPCHDVDNPIPFVVFRSQLPRDNTYYSYEPPATEEPTLDQVQSMVEYGTLPLCGCLGDKVCAKCKTIRYCSKTHQIMHWKSEHKLVCNPDLPVPIKGPSFTQNEFLLPEYKICSEMAEDITSIVPESDESSAEEPEVAEEVLVARRFSVCLLCSDDLRRKLTSLTTANCS
ncbi:unnamed protein product [Echinostoma caproni]|uniref:MYND-type domain-containing protein n=1 Tax=Echinostoma caproni TaxID=27848 RepID=A0A183AT19_9TREM|nr:unnamed protein product [Echinostoma caproni]